MNTTTRPIAGLQRFTRAKEERFTFRRQDISGKLIDRPKPINSADIWLGWSHQSGKAYEVSAAQCSCPDWQYRCSAAGRQCKHQMALEEHLREEASND